MLSNLLFVCLSWLVTEPQTRTLELDIERSEITFSATHMGFLSVKGSFREFESSIILEYDLISQVEGEIWVASINTEEPSRDETLLSEGYLDAAQFPSIHFSSSFIDKEISGYTITGTLRIKGETRTVSIPCEVIIEHDRSVLLNGKITIKRSTFNLDFGSMDALIGDEIQVSVKLAFVD